MQRLRTKAGKQQQIYLDASLDESGWSPEALARIVELGTRLPYEEASLVAHRFGLGPNRSLLNELTDACAKECRQEVAALLSPANGGVESDAQQAGRIMVLQIDGVCVLGRPEAGSCPGLEIKSAVLYPQSSPGGVDAG